MGAPGFAVRELTAQLLELCILLLHALDNRLYIGRLSLDRKWLGLNRNRLSLDQKLLCLGRRGLNLNGSKLSLIRRRKRAGRGHLRNRADYGRGDAGKREACNESFEQKAALHDRFPVNLICEMPGVFSPAPVGQVTRKIAARIKNCLSGISDIGGRKALDENNACY